MSRSQLRKREQSKSEKPVSKIADSPLSNASGIQLHVGLSEATILKLLAFVSTLVAALYKVS